jgi:uncharacterized protein
MGADTFARPLIWVLKGIRAGDTAQAMELALQIGGRVEGKQLSFNRLHMLPNWLTGARQSHLTSEARTLLRPPWPDLVVATGKRTAPVSLWIKQQSGGRTCIVQLGRPRMRLQNFDLVVTTPQYGLPARSNVMEVLVPFARPKIVSPVDLKAFQVAWEYLPRPWFVGVLGGQKFPQRLAVDEITKFGKLLESAARNSGGSIILLDSPRSPPGGIDRAAKLLTAPYWMFRRNRGPNPYQAALALGDAFVVTSDSVSMVTEMVLTGKPTSVFRLPTAAWVPTWSAQTGPGAVLAAAGILHPPRDVDGLIALLESEGYIATLGAGEESAKPDALAASHGVVVSRIRALLGEASGSLMKSST